jgi:quinol monooxygenase YgiN
MIAVIATLRIVAEQSEAFEQVFAELSATVLANEPNTKLYQLCRSKTDPSLYRVLELYESQADVDAHLQSDWFKAASPKLGRFLTERPILEPLDTIG